jgi:4-hydroxybenzoate polyprenyltransferase
VVLVDAFCIASGFLLRLAAGGVAAEAEVSRWAFLCTLFLALFLALNKRRAELALLGEAGASTRASLQHYSLAFLDQMVSVLAACTIVAYTMYTVDPDTARKFGEGGVLFWSVPFVAFGIGRYMVLVQSGRGGENPARILLGGDGWFLANTFAWAAVVGFALFARG